jgi:hypothetical protein
MQREREAELIFRGEQYVEAIRLFKKRHGRFPVKLKELWEAKPPVIRKQWADPITGSRAWGLVFEGQGGRQIGPGGGLPGQVNLVNQPGQTDRQFGGQGRGLPPREGRDGGDTRSGFGPDPEPTGTPGAGGRGSGGMGGGGPNPALFVVSGEDGELPKPEAGRPARTGPIIGVHSTSCEESIRIYEGRTTYCEWRFVYREREGQGGGARGGGQGRGGTGFHPGNQKTPRPRITGTPVT